MQIFFDLRAAMQPEGKRPYRGFEQITEHQITDRQKRRGRRQNGQTSVGGHKDKTQTLRNRNARPNSHRATAIAVNAYPLKPAVKEKSGADAEVMSATRTLVIQSKRKHAGSTNILPGTTAQRQFLLIPKSISQREKSGADADVVNRMNARTLNSQRKHARTNTLEPSSTAQRQFLPIPIILISQ